MKIDETKAHLLSTTVRAATMIDESAQVSLRVSINHLKEIMQAIKRNINGVHSMCYNYDGGLQKSGVQQNTGIIR
jgi:hypothetical protein